VVDGERHAAFTATTRVAGDARARPSAAVANRPIARWDLAGPQDDRVDRDVARHAARPDLLHPEVRVRAIVGAATRRGRRSARRGVQAQGAAGACASQARRGLAGDAVTAPTLRGAWRVPLRRQLQHGSEDRARRRAGPWSRDDDVTGSACLHRAAVLRCLRRGGSFSRSEREPKRKHAGRGDPKPRSDGGGATRPIRRRRRHALDPNLSFGARSTPRRAFRRLHARPAPGERPPKLVGT
jgi:hypothetical protein